MTGRSTSVIGVQVVVLPDGERTWTVLGADHLPVAPVEEFLEHHRVIGSSPNTVKSYAHGTALWWRYLGVLGTVWDEPRVSTVTGFISWLRGGADERTASVTMLPSAQSETAVPSDTTVRVRLAAVGAFYRYHESASGVPFPATQAARRSSRYRPFLAHLESRRPPRPVLARLKRPVAGPAPTLTPGQIDLILESCAHRNGDGE